MATVQEFNPRMSPKERRASFSLAGIFGLRMLGLFLLLPILSLHAETLPGATPLLIGLALGSYGLTQAIFQIPFGAASDRWGRKPVIAAGLLLFALGSGVAALADTISVLLLGRALQGAGAVAAAVIALVADLTREETRTRAMALIGMAVGGSFGISMLLGPSLAHWIGVPGVFWLTAVLALLAIGLLYLVVPEPVASPTQQGVQLNRRALSEVLRNPLLARLDLGIFTLHFILTALFVIIPLLLVQKIGLGAGQHWQLYLPVLLISGGLMLLVVVAAERGYFSPHYAFNTAIAVVAVGLLLMIWGVQGFWGMVTALLVFFTGFNILESFLPSLVSKAAPMEAKGTAVGVYNLSEFFGAFLGGTAGGAVYGSLGATGVFLVCALLALIWLGSVWTAATPHYLVTRTLKVSRVQAGEVGALEQALLQIEGVMEARVSAEDRLAYCKLDRRRIDEAQLKAAFKGVMSGSEPQVQATR